MSRTDINDFDAARVRRALGAIGDGPVVDSVDDLLERKGLRQERQRPDRGRRLLFAAVIAAAIVIGGVTGATRLQSERDFVAVDTTGCTGARWCVESPRGLALVGEEIFAVSVSGKLVAVDRVAGMTREVRLQTGLSDEAQVAGGFRDGLLIVDKDRVLVVGLDGEIRTELESTAGSVFVDAAADPSGERTVAIVDGPSGRRRLVVYIGGQLVNEAEASATLDHLAVASDGQAFAVDAFTGDLLIVADGDGLLQRPAVSMTGLTAVADISARGNAILVLTEETNGRALIELRPSSGESGYWPQLPDAFAASHVAADSETRRVALSSTTDNQVVTLEPPSGADGAFSDPD